MPNVSIPIWVQALLALTLLSLGLHLGSLAGALTFPAWGSIALDGCTLAIGIAMWVRVRFKQQEGEKEALMVQVYALESGDEALPVASRGGNVVGNPAAGEREA